MLSRLRPQARQALYIGAVCFFAYLTVYIARNLLSVAAPQMMEKGVLDNERLGTFSFLLFICYACGQLINGILGDRIPCKYMLGIGLTASGVFTLAFIPAIQQNGVTAYLLYGAIGFCLSMIYGPMTKAVAENTEPPYTIRCSVGYSFASYLGSPAAALLVVLPLWTAMFRVGGALLTVMGVLLFIAFTAFEKRGMMVCRPRQHKQKQRNGLSVLLQRQIVRFASVALLTGVVRTSVVFWLPTYAVQYLGFSEKTAAALFSVATAVIALNAFASTAVYHRFGDRTDRTLLLSFAASALAFLGAFCFRHAAMNLLCMVVAIFCCNCASSVLWSIYCPSLWDTGMVSGATGFLDFLSYMAAAVSSKLFATAVTHLGWRWLILIWCALMLAGVTVALPTPHKQKKQKP